MHNLLRYFAALLLCLSLTHANTLFVVNMCYFFVCHQHVLLQLLSVLPTHFFFPLFDHVQRLICASVKIRVGYILIFQVLFSFEQLFIKLLQRIIALFSFALCVARCIQFVLLYNFKPVVVPFSCAFVISSCVLHNQPNVHVFVSCNDTSSSKSNVQPPLLLLTRICRLMLLLSLLTTRLMPQ